MYSIKKISILIFALFAVMTLYLGCEKNVNTSEGNSTEVAGTDSNADIQADDQSDNQADNQADSQAGTDVTDNGTENGSGNQTLSYTYPIVDTNQSAFYGTSSEIREPAQGETFYGQDASYKGNQPSYKDNGDGTVTDLNTGLMWQKDPGEKMSYSEAEENLKSFSLGGYTDWRIPTIKELYSLIEFSGYDPSGWSGTDTSLLTPFMDTAYFNFSYGDESSGERIIDSQYMSSTKYVSTTMNGDETVFGVNFADGRIKGYPVYMQGEEKKFFVIYVRGNENYGKNDFADNGDGTITDRATGLMWMTKDSGSLNAGGSEDGSMNWQEALDWAENLEYAGYSDWRLPNAKELQSIIDYTRSPDTTNSAAIDPLFEVTPIIDEGGSKNYPFYWTGTTHANMVNSSNAVYLSFGEALGWMQFPYSSGYTLMDVHGAGAQRSDPKTGSASDYPYGHGPQGDVIRIYNYVRCVRNIN